MKKEAKRARIEAIRAAKYADKAIGTEEEEVAAEEAKEAEAVASEAEAKVEAPKDGLLSLEQMEQLIDVPMVDGEDKKMSPKEKAIDE